jgi:hypothetical protein
VTSPANALPPNPMMVAAAMAALMSGRFMFYSWAIEPTAVVVTRRMFPVTSGR